MVTRVLVAGGGTGGHVIPSLATAAALAAARGDLEVEFLGTADRLEGRLVPAAGWRLHAVPTAALPRRLDPALLRLPWVLLRAVRRARALIAEREAAVAACFGGYVSLPLALAARRARIPLVVHEQNAIPGVTNRIAARFADAVAVTFPESAARFGRAQRRVVVTGNPVRPELAGLDRAGLRADALAAFGLEPGRRTLLVFGGSQGARRLNEAITASVGRWAEPERLQILHATGTAAHPEISAAWDAALAGRSAPLVLCVPYLDRMDLAYAAADLVLCRAGASSIAELTTLGLASILVPYPYATADHQTANARAVAAAGAAVVLDDARVDAATLVATAERLLLDDAGRDAMAAAARAWGRPDAAAAVAALILERLPSPVGAP